MYPVHQNQATFDRRKHHFTLLKGQTYLKISSQNRAINKGRITEKFNINVLARDNQRRKSILYTHSVIVSN